MTKGYVIIHERPTILGRYAAHAVDHHYMIYFCNIHKCAKTDYIYKTKEHAIKDKKYGCADKQLYPIKSCYIVTFEEFQLMYAEYKLSKT
jgi:hypothetical protein